jgi:hypothetical protein
MSPSVLLIAGHVGIEDLTTEGLCDNRDVVELRRGTGTRGEREWTGNAVQLTAAAMRAVGIDAVATDARYDAALFTRAWDLVIAFHLQRDRASAKAFAAIPDPAHGYQAPIASAASQKWLDRFVNEYEVVTGIPVTEIAVTDRMTDLYEWCYITPTTNAAIAELGHADLNADVLFEPQIARVVKALTLITQEFLAADLGLTLGAPSSPAPSPVPTEPFPLSTFPVVGIWTGDPAALDDAIRSYAQGPVPDYFGLELARFAATCGIRADVVAAQVMHETGRFRFDGTDPVFSARLAWNNYGGIKTTDGTATAHFDDLPHGLMAMCAHVAWYAQPDHIGPFCSPQYDPRHFGAHRNTLHTLADFGGGVWNSSPVPQYGSAVARHLAELRARIATYVPAPAPPVIDDGAKLARAKEHARAILDL